MVTSKFFLSRYGGFVFKSQKSLSWIRQPFFFFWRQVAKIRQTKIKNTDNHPFFPSFCMKTASAIRLVSEITGTEVDFFFFLSPKKTQNRQLSDSQLLVGAHDLRPLWSPLKTFNFFIFLFLCVFYFYYYFMIIQPDGLFIHPLNRNGQ